MCPVSHRQARPPLSVSQARSAVWVAQRKQRPETKKEEDEKTERKAPSNVCQRVRIPSHRRSKRAFHLQSSSYKRLWSRGRIDRYYICLPLGAQLFALFDYRRSSHYDSLLLFIHSEMYTMLTPTAALIAIITALACTVTGIPTPTTGGVARRSFVSAGVTCYCACASPLRRTTIVFLLDLEADSIFSPPFDGPFRPFLSLDQCPTLTGATFTGGARQLPSGFFPAGYSCKCVCICGMATSQHRRYRCHC